MEVTVRSWSDLQDSPWGSKKEEFWVFFSFYPRLESE